MKHTVKNPGISIKGLIAGGLIAGAVGLGFGEGSYGSPSTGSTPSSSAMGTEGSGMDTGVGGSKSPDMAQALPPNVAPGWKIRVCSEKTKARTIDFRAYPADDKSAGKAAKKTSEKASETGAKPMGTGTGGEATTQDPSAAQADIQTTSWSQGQSSLITLPESLAGIEKIKIEAVPGQKDMKSEVCVLYNDHVAKKLSFDDRSEATVKMNESGTCGC